MTTKTCTVCKIVKSFDEFSNDKSKKDGKRPSCKLCKSSQDAKYKLANKEKCQINDKKYYEKNQEAIKNRAKQWYQDNKTECLEKAKKWRQDNFQKWKEGKRKWYEANKEKMRNYINEYIKTKYHNDINYRIKSICAARIRSLCKNENSTFELIGCSAQFFRLWIEYHFDEHMSWDNIGCYWHFDHVKPCSSYNLNLEDELRACFHWSNLRPLEANANLVKHDTIDELVILAHEEKVKLFRSQYEDVPSQ